MPTTGEATPDQSELRCSFAAEARGDPQLGTASPAAGFLLIEHPGAWGHLALTESGLDPDVVSALGARALAASLRVLLIKRPGRRPRRAQQRWALADATPGRERIEWGSFVDDSELLELPLETDPRGDSTEPCYLVCTHGRHDACCALRGRPVAAAFARVRPEATWECSHVGGDRFAANVVVLPHGLYYGRAGTDDAAGIVAAHERGEVALDHLRGRSVYRSAVQAAQHFARRELGVTAIDGLAPLDETSTEDGGTTVRLAHGDGVVRVTVRPVVGPEPGLLTCRATNPLHPPTHALDQFVHE